MHRRVSFKERLILHLDLAIPSDVQAIGPVVEKVMWVAGQMGCAKGKEFAIETALRESLADEFRRAGYATETVGDIEDGSCKSAVPRT